MDGVKRITLDMADLAWIVAGGELVLPELNLTIEPGSDLFRLSQRVRTRVNGGRRTIHVKPRPAAE